MKIAQMLLESVYFKVSAVASLNERGEMISIGLFSTDFPDTQPGVALYAREVWLISNHPEGNRAPYPQDICNYRALLGRANGCKVRLFLCSEYFECFEIKGIGREDACVIMDAANH